MDINSLAPERYDSNFERILLRHISVADAAYGYALKVIPLDLTDDE